MHLVRVPSIHPYTCIRRALREISMGMRPAGPGLHPKDNPRRPLCAPAPVPSRMLPPAVFLSPSCPPSLCAETLATLASTGADRFPEEIAAGYRFPPRRDEIHVGSRQT